MADLKLSSLTASTTYDSAQSYVFIVDESDTTQAATGSNFKVSIDQFLSDAQNSVFSRTAVTTSYSVLSSDNLLGVNAAAALTITLPDPSTVTAGKRYIIKDEAGNAATNNITVDTAAGLIDGQSSVEIIVDYTSITIYTNGTNWYLI